MSSDQLRGIAQYADHAPRAAGWTNAAVGLIVQNNQRASVESHAPNSAKLLAADRAPNKRFGVEVLTRSIVGDRTGDVSLAPELIAEGGIT